MTVRMFTDSQLYRTGSLKWTGVTRSDGSPTIGAWVAEMDFGTAPEVSAAMKRAIRHRLLGYPPRWLEGPVAAPTPAFPRHPFGS